MCDGLPFQNRTSFQMFHQVTQVKLTTIQNLDTEKSGIQVSSIHLVTELA